MVLDIVFILCFRSFRKLVAIANVHGKLAWWASSDGVKIELIILFSWKFDGVVLLK